MSNKKMAAKQTQTKVFDFSDVGLDFCSGSRNLFPDRFKKMFALGYNEQTVTGVSVAGNQVTFTYGGVHGYVADRVLKVDSGVLSSINGGEFWIDSVTTNTITVTIEDAPSLVTSGFTTRIAPLGWEIVYEVGPVHIYRFKHFDETYMFLRLFFNLATGSQKNYVTPCIGKSYNPATGFIDDINAYQVNAQAMDWSASHKWLFEVSWSSGHSNSNYTQGFSTFGKAVCIGSAYHMVMMYNTGSNNFHKNIAAVLPCYTYDYDVLDYPLLFANYQNVAPTGTGGADYSVYTALGQGVVGNYRIVFEKGTADPVVPNAISSILPTGIDSFNTATASPIYLYERDTRQVIGVVESGLYVGQFSTTNAPQTTSATTPSEHYDPDTTSELYVHPIYSGSTNRVYFIAPVEEVKIV